MIGLDAGLDAIINGEPIRIFLFAVAAPDNASDIDLVWKLEFDPAFAAFVGNPTVAVAVFAVVQMFEAMDVGVGKDARGSGFGAGTGQRNVCSGSVVNFEFIDARLGIGGACDGEAKPFGLHWRKSLNVSAGIH